MKNKLKYQNYDEYNINKVLNKESFTHEESIRHEKECLNLLNNLV